MARQTQRSARGINGPDDPALDQRCESFLAWSQQLEKAYPGKDLFRSAISPTMITPLFDDSAFVPYFGKPYDQITAQERSNFTQNTIRACQNSSNRSKFSWQFDALGPSFMGQPLNNNPSSPNQLIVAIQNLRRAKTSLAMLEEQLKAAPASPEGFDQVMTSKKSAAPLLGLMWPSDQANFDAIASAALSRVSGPALDAKLRPLVANASGFDGLHTLKTATQQFKDLFAAAPQAEKAKWQQNIDAKIHSLLVQQMAEQRGQLDKIESGPNGLKQSAQWYAAFARYDSDRDDPEVAQVLQAFRTKRSAQLVAAEGQIGKAIQQARTESEVAQVLPQYISLPGDDSAPGMDKLSAAAKDREAELHRKEMIGTESANSDGESRPSGGSSSSQRPKDGGGSAGGGPSAAELYDALQARVDAYNGGQDELKKRCDAFRKTQTQDAPLALQCMAIWVLENGGQDKKYDLKVTITSFHDLGCEKSQGHVGYNCTYSIALSQNNPAMTGLLGDIIQGSNLTEARFLQDGKKWIMAP